jgi:hypothetical protein
VKLYTEEMAVERMIRWAKNGLLPAFDNRSLCPDGVLRTVAQMKAEIVNRAARKDAPLTCNELSGIVGPFMLDDMQCDQCEASSKKLVEVGEPMDDESRTARLCRQCVAAALDMFK